jgi:A/G-specific adenine glycosylase
LLAHIKKKNSTFKIDILTFTTQLINWYTDRKRDLPWRKTKDPYPIWLSEIILQQTRVDQGLPYWERFVSTYPTISDLALAPENEVLRLWQGLGYYSRARNLHSTAKYVHEHLAGIFPNAYSEILQLKGIGPYTAAAISSICYNEAKPVVDGNVFRFTSRYFGLMEDTSGSKARSVFEALLNDFIDKKDPGTFNQAMMEFGATVCSPKPNCESCPFRIDCFAFKNNLQSDLPVKTKKTKIRTRIFHYLVFRNKSNFFLNQRVDKDVWNSLFDFHLLEGEYDQESIFKNIEALCGSEFLIEEISEKFIHILSHQKIHAIFYEVTISDRSMKMLLNRTKLKEYTEEEMLTLPKAKLIVNYLQRFVT